MSETTHTGLDKLGEMDMDELLYWCAENRRYIEARNEAIREQLGD